MISIRWFPMTGICLKSTLMCLVFLYFGFQFSKHLLSICQALYFVRSKIERFALASGVRILKPPFYIPTRSAGEFQLFHIFTNICSSENSLTVY